MTTETKTRRQRYLDHELTHEEYYREIAKDLGVSFVGDERPIVKQARAALAAGDKHLNSIPLVSWDRLGAYILRSSRTREVFKAHGDYPSLAGMVCVFKQAVKQAIEVTS